MGTDYLIIILLWCGNPNFIGSYGGTVPSREVTKCRKEAIACVRGLKAFDTDKVVDKCLLGGGK